MTILADAGEMTSFGLTIIFAIALPTIGIIANAATIGRRGLNPRCAFSTTLFFVALLLSGITIAMMNKDAIHPAARFYCFSAAAAIHALSAFLAGWGLSELRTRRKWSHGRQRGQWGFWLNIGALILLSTWFYLQVNHAARHRFFD